MVQPLPQLLGKTVLSSLLKCDLMSWQDTGVQKLIMAMTLSP